MPTLDSLRVLDDRGQELPLQLDIVRTWEDGSVRTALLTLAPTLEALETVHYTLCTGEEPPSAVVRNPVSVTRGGAGLSVNQGPVTYRVGVTQQSLVDRVVAREKSFLRGGSRGAVLLLNDGQECLPEGSGSLDVATRGPWSASVRAERAYEEGFSLATTVTVVSSKSWYLLEHQVTAGDASRIAVLVQEFHLDLVPDRLASAYGARVTSDGESTSWAVVTDGEFTVDLAALDAWSAAGSVRYEVGSDARVRVIFPYGAERTFRVYAHYLHGPPDDVRNTPAAAMAAGLSVRAQPAL